MTDLNLSEGQEFHAGGKRFIIRDGVPVQEEKRGPLDGVLRKFSELPVDRYFFMRLKKIDDNHALNANERLGVFHDQKIKFDKDQLVEFGAIIHKPKRCSAQYAASLPDIGSKKIALPCDVFEYEHSNQYPLRVLYGKKKIDVHYEEIVEVLD